MTITRSLNYASAANGEEWAGDADDTINHLFGQMLGELFNVRGTNTIRANIEITEGFSSLSNDALCFLIPRNSNTGSVTLNISNSGALPIRSSSGANLALGELRQSTKYLLHYTNRDGYWRVIAGGAGGTGTTVDTPAIPASHLSLGAYVFARTSNNRYVSIPGERIAGADLRFSSSANHFGVAIGGDGMYRIHGESDRNSPNDSTVYQRVL